ncbi:hypothetical protein [Rubrobacter indicoceani]|uniref:hypothetical protein n=1 Tax=Rubrobacter indicoceani TaxID=2051957 RepID=UPI000E5B339B|nr:hypothetical protein [Rubrobacter indicoceani]
MSRRAVVHIGIDKTGSKTVQNTFYGAREPLLSEERILYPSVSVNLSVPLAVAFQDVSPTTLRPIKSPLVDESSLERTRRNFRAALEAELDRDNWETLVLSAESLCDFAPREVSRFMEWLGGYTSDVRIIAYVRHPVEWTRSSLQQHVKGGRSLEDLYENPPLPNWRRRFTPWLEAFGRERFTLVSFDDAIRGDGLAASFCDAAGLPREKILPFVPAAPVNESMSHEAVLLLDSLNRQRPLMVDGAPSPKRRWKGTGTIKKIPGRKFRLSAEQETLAGENVRPDLDWLNETFGTNLFPDIFDKAAKNEEAAPQEIPQETIDALARLISDYGNRIKSLKEARSEPLKAPNVISKMLGRLRLRR